MSRRSIKMNRWILMLLIVLIAINTPKFIEGIGILINGHPKTHRMFSDIDHLKRLSDYSTVSNIYDYKIGDLNYERAYVDRIIYNSVKFDIYAYVFHDLNDRETYYHRVSDGITTILDQSYTWHTEDHKYYYIAYSGKNVLVIVSKYIAHIADLMDAFPDVFDLALEDAIDAFKEAIISG